MKAQCDSGLMIRFNILNAKMNDLHDRHMYFVFVLLSLIDYELIIVGRLII